jgi:hypothetical protein
MRTVTFWTSVVLMGFLGLSGVQGAIGDWSLVTTLGQRLSVLGQGTFGVCGVVAGVGAILKRSWAGAFAAAFAISAGVTAGLASVFWGGSNLATGIASGGLGLLIGFLLYRGVGLRALEPGEE